MLLGEQFAGLDGFLGTRGSLMLDLVFLAMFAIVPVLSVSVYLVKYRRQYRIHKQIQVALGVVLLVAVTAFEVDMRFFTDWKERAAPSPYFEPETWNPVWYSLIVHLCFAVPTTLLWIYVIVAALRRFPIPPGPSDYSLTHVFWARLATVGMVMTAATGWVFYWLAFVA
jgi:membrane-associated HD superfamily phosphohydrolase